MPVLMIWPPEGENAYGHAALQTEKYHMSFWPRNRIEGMAKLKASNASGVAADLILHHQRDKYLEEGRNPNQYVISTVSDEDLDRIFEEFLRFNGIDPKHVAEVKARVNRLIRLKQTEQLLPMIQDGKDLDIALSKTKYSFLPDLMKEKNPSGLWAWFTHPGGNSSFNERAQSCTSFCYHLIELADKSKDTMTPIPMNSYTFLLNVFPRATTVPAPSKPVLDVPTLEHLAQEHYT